MKIIRAQVQGFQRVVMIDATPTDAVVEVRGDNGEGKTSLLSAIQAALGGADAAPIKPIRTGDDFAAIRLTIGDGKPDLIVTKYFDEAGEKLRVENADGAEWKAGQTHVSNLLGRMTFDPLAFAKKNPTDQAVELRRLVPLKVDLDQLAAADKADVALRRDVNRDGKVKVAQRDAINVSGIIPAQPDRDAIVGALAGAAGVNTAIERERDRRAEQEREAANYARTAEGRRAKAENLRKEADELVADAVLMEQTAFRIGEELRDAPPLDEPVDTAKLSADLAQADADLALLARVAERKRLDDEVSALRAQSEAFTTAIANRAKERTDALASAEMPVPGLSLARLCDVVTGETDESLIVVYEGEPFAQASGAQQLRVSMRLAMAANPKLRVMLIRDGSLLDANGLALVKEMAGEKDYQVWLESVGEGDGSGLIMEAGTVRGAPEPERLDPPKRRKAKVDEVADQTDAEVEKIREESEVKVQADQLVRDQLNTPPARRKPSEMRKPAGDLFGGDR